MSLCRVMTLQHKQNQSASLKPRDAIEVQLTLDWDQWRS